MSPVRRGHEAGPGREESLPDLPSLSRRLAEEGGPAIRACSSDSLRAAWNTLLDDVLTPSSSFWVRDGLLDAACVETGLPPASLHAGLQAAVTGLRMDRELEVAPSARNRPALAILAGNIPVIPFQVLLPALLRRRPLLFKPPSTATKFPAAILGRLSRDLPAAAEAFRIARWPGGDPLEECLTDSPAPFSQVLVFGDADTVARYRRIAADADDVEVLTFGPKTSIALVVDRGEERPSWLRPVARDVALFDQRGCLSVTAVHLIADAETTDRRAAQLAAELGRLRESLPVGTRSPAELVAPRQWLDRAVLAGRRVHGDLASGGAVLLGTHTDASPGARCVVMIRHRELSAAVAALQADGGLQGVTLTGLAEDQARRTARTLRQAGISRVVGAGELQLTDLAWRNAGVDLLEVL